MQRVQALPFPALRRMIAPMLHMITLETERLILRNYKASDLDAYHAMLSDGENMTYLYDIVTHSLEESKESLENAMAVNAAGRARRFAITLKGADTLIGAVGYEIAAHTPAGKIADPMGWFLMPAYQNKGYMTEGVKRVLAYAFLRDDCAEVITGCFAENLPTQRVMEKAGFGNKAESQALPHDGKMKKRLRFSLSRESYMSAYYLLHK
ncbi:MAG: GNAT family N-acetyltransferase [Defluviitaleaceae bacterium]|nr:GNAT family N-acetyltransferase [Defluviitaleaceae bacterium]